MLYNVTVIFPDGFSDVTYSLTFAAAQYFKRMALLRGASSVSVEPESAYQ